jgi:hypothetical protein
METYKKANFDYSGSGMTNTPTGGGDDSTDDVWEDVVE